MDTGKTVSNKGKKKAKSKNSNQPEKDALVDDLLWPFRQYNSVREFASKVQSASVTVGLTGILLQSIGVAPEIAAAIGSTGFAATLTEVILRILFESRKPLKKFPSRRRAFSAVLYIGVAFVLFLLIGPGTLSKLGVSSIQFATGLIITYVDIFIFMRVYRYLEYPKIKTSTQIIVSILASEGFTLTLILFIPVLLHQLGQDQAKNIFIGKTSLMNKTAS